MSFQAEGEMKESSSGEVRTTSLEYWSCRAANHWDREPFQDTQAIGILVAAANFGPGNPESGWK